MKSTATPAKAAPDASVKSVFTEVRYSLPEMLAELQTERTTGSYAMEKFSQVEIEKLFKAKAAAPRHAKRKD
jgi:hypothetical protein